MLSALGGMAQACVSALVLVDSWQPGALYELNPMADLPPLRSPGPSTRRARYMKRGSNGWRYAALVAALAEYRPKSFTIDRGVTVFDRDLVSRFEWLRHRTGL